MSIFLVVVWLISAAARKEQLSSASTNDPRGVF